MFLHVIDVAIDVRQSIRPMSPHMPGGAESNVIRITVLSEIREFGPRISRHGILPDGQLQKSLVLRTLEVVPGRRRPNLFREEPAKSAQNLNVQLPAPKL
jgi:hypothetical protein